jgi:glycosyltransferase involved in cell wall biosynthesis
VLTVLLATRNGAATLPGVLEAYCELQPPQGAWKLVVVDNGSTDSSRQLIAGFKDRLPLMYVFEREVGKNLALNTGLAFVSGDLVVLTDDDAFPRSDWLVRLREAADCNPTVGILGGSVVPRWEVPPPDWVLDGVPLGWTYTVSDPSLPPGPVDGRQIFGPNMAVRSAVFDAGYRFDPSIGPDGSGSYTMGSETEFILRVLRSGVTAWYVPTAIVDHFVRAKQLRRLWITRRMMRAGRCECRLYLQYPQASQWSLGFRRAPTLRPRCFGFPLPLAYHLARRAASVVLAMLRLNRERTFHAVWTLSYVYGFAREAQAANRKPLSAVASR